MEAKHCTEISENITNCDVTDHNLQTNLMETINGFNKINLADNIPTIEKNNISGGKATDCPTENQLKLFKLISEFSTEIIVGTISSAYNRLGPKVVANPGICRIILPFLEHYFNLCAQNSETRNDKYFCEKFDQMMQIKLDRPSHYVDLLNIVIGMTLIGLQTMKITDLITDDYEASMNAVKSHIESIFETYEHVALILRGCEHKHDPILPDENVYKFTVETN